MKRSHCSVWPHVISNLFLFASALFFLFVVFQSLSLPHAFSFYQYYIILQAHSLLYDICYVVLQANKKKRKK